MVYLFRVIQEICFCFPLGWLHSLAAPPLMVARCPLVAPDVHPFLPQPSSGEVCGQMGELSGLSPPSGPQHVSGLTLIGQDSVSCSPLNQLL